MPKAAKASKPDKEDEKMQSLFDFYKSNKSYTSAGVTDEHSYFLTNAGRLGRLKLENVGGEKPLSTLHSSCGSSQSASLQVPDDAKQFDFASETWKFLASTAVAKKSPPKAEKRAAEPTASSRKAIKGSDSAELSKLRSDMAELAHKREQDKAEIERLRVENAALGEKLEQAAKATKAQRKEKLQINDEYIKTLEQIVELKKGTQGCLCSWKQPADQDFTRRARTAMVKHLLLQVHPDKMGRPKRDVSAPEAAAIDRAATELTKVANALLR